MSKTYDFIILLKKSTFKLIDFINQFMILLAVAGFLFEAYHTLFFENTYLTETTGILLIVICLLMIGWWIYCFRTQKMASIPYYRLALMFGAFGWFLIPNGIWIGFVYIVAAILEKPIKVQPEIGFDNEEIAINSFPVKKIQWSMVNNVVLKDGLLTIDLKNNQLIQKEVHELVSKETEHEFNTFCKEQLQPN
ncbi:MAG: hypothetical protein ACOVNY_10535 [Chitinophagaceae bacterium]